MPEKAQIVFAPSGRRGQVPIGATVLEAAREIGVDIDSVCGGHHGICGRCQVSLSTGAFPKLGLTCEPSHLSPFSDDEARYRDKHGLLTGRRLACVARIAGDVVIDVPPESQVHKQIVRKRPDTRAVEVDPVVRLHYVELTPPTIDDQRTDLVRLREALQDEWDIVDLTCDGAALAGLPGALIEGQWKITVAVREGNRLIAAWPGLRERLFGLAIDIGTTTIAVTLCDLDTGNVVGEGGVMNPQIRFGEDLISRVSYIQLSPLGVRQLTAVARKAILRLAADTAADAGIELADIVEATVVGNPIMHHIFLGLDPLGLGRAPFTLVVDEALAVKATDVGLRIHPGAHAYTLPCIAGHVGADTAGVLLSEAPHESDEVVLVVDVGTNAEIVLGNRGRLLACSSPTGPAFEGAQISSGQRAALGAIERVRIDPETLAPRFRVIGSDLWSDEEGFEDSIASIGVTGVCGSGIIEAVAEMYLVGLVDAGGRVTGERTKDCAHVVRSGEVYDYLLHQGPPALYVTQTDVRSIQLAKAALYAGARLLMDNFGVESVERIVLAGAFGTYMDPLHAMILGMIPDCDLSRVVAAGNAAGAGARIALLSRRARAEIEDLVGRVEKIETAAEKRFHKYFVAAMAFPHRDDTFPNLERALANAEPSRLSHSDRLVDKSQPAPRAAR